MKPDFCVFVPLTICTEIAHTVSLSRCLVHPGFLKDVNFYEIISVMLDEHRHMPDGQTYYFEYNEKKKCIQVNN